MADWARQQQQKIYVGYCICMPGSNCDQEPQELEMSLRSIFHTLHSYEG